MSELIDEDVVGEFTKGGSEAKLEGVCPPMKALYSYATQPLKS
jgi:hypothetical protein